MPLFWRPGPDARPTSVGRRPYFTGGGARGAPWLGVELRWWGRDGGLGIHLELGGCCARRVKGAQSGVYGATVARCRGLKVVLHRLEGAAGGVGVDPVP